MATRLTQEAKVVTMRACALGASIVAVGVLASEPVVAAHPPARSPSCEPLFGDDDVHIVNEQRRRGVLLELARSGEGINLVHAKATWARPRPLKIAGFAPLSRRRVVGSGGVEAITALVVIGEALTPACEPGTYELHVDDSISPLVQVLAITREGILVEHSGGLAFVTFAEATMPEFRMIWRSGFRLLSPPPSAVPPRPAPPPRKK